MAHQETLDIVEDWKAGKDFHISQIRKPDWTDMALTEYRAGTELDRTDIIQCSDNFVDLLDRLASAIDETDLNDQHVKLLAAMNIMQNILITNVKSDVYSDLEEAS